jgi:hypothetical protein
MGSRGGPKPGDETNRNLRLFYRSHQHLKMEIDIVPKALKATSIFTLLTAGGMKVSADIIPAGRLDGAGGQRKPHNFYFKRTSCAGMYVICAGERTN